MCVLYIYIYIYIHSGLPKRNKNNATEIANLALDIVNNVVEANAEEGFSIAVRFRIGINSGKYSDTCHLWHNYLSSGNGNYELIFLYLSCSGTAMAGTVGTQSLQYCVFGDTMNVASRMASQGLREFSSHCQLIFCVKCILFC